MKNKIKILIIAIFLLFNSKCFGISEDFKFVIDTIGIPQFNVYNNEINEEIYYTYNVFSYSDPVTISKNTSRQRFKEVPVYGKWTENGSAYKGVGRRGEYYILGTGYSGNYIDNVYFPVDSIPETTPNNWNYISLSDALSSWNNRDNYKYKEQLDYMKTTPLLFDELDIKNNISNSYNLVEYGISAEKIGLEKTKLNTCSTWKTMGIVTARRMSSAGKIRDAIFATKPMAANADIISELEVNDNILLNEVNEPINIKFGANVINLNGYAKKEHIKEICSIIYIDGKEVSKISGSKIANVDKNILFAIPNETKNDLNTYKLNIKILSYMYTDFSVDGLIKNTLEKNINITIPKKSVVPIKKLDIKILKNHNNLMVVSPLVQTNTTNAENSLGVIELSRNLAIKIKFESDIGIKQDIKIYINNVLQDIKLLQNNVDTYIYEIKLNANILNTIKSWKYMRDKNNDYFSIDFQDIGNRVCSPNILKIKCIYDNKINEKELKFDTIDEFIYNFGYDFSNIIINKSTIDIMENIDEWIKE